MLRYARRNISHYQVVGTIKVHKNQTFKHSKKENRRIKVNHDKLNSILVP